MKTNIFNITALVLMVTSSFIAGRNTIENNIIELPSESLIENTEIIPNSYSMVEAKIVNGEVIPHVELPELTITANYNEESMVSAQIVDGEVIPVVQLPELTIYSE